jgi:hypothetical protein
MAGIGEKPAEETTKSCLLRFFRMMKTGRVLVLL